ncbi:aspartate 1-decarboxylase [Helicobacter sp. 11S02629-2]|uniref:aspartate 1-decarboxylase n=1 Tax=Helicobacter sp. 11S02629-2 TaxID=1476195 RepID=UPI000BA5172D|nr:aspartate 1-decarboxylase [Helicobacter sp. 11S02629-2]PAF45406.1 aspartate 1-decarboxylase [Helicobacter sp. 11S02629-2]
MTVNMLYSKIHRATITDSNLNYVGSISLDKRLIKAANLLPGIKVDIVNVNNGARFSTYVIESEVEGTVCVNGAAARLVQTGDVVIIIAYAQMSLIEAESYEPKIVKVDSKNLIV